MSALNPIEPQPGDYVQLLDAKGKPSENFTLVSLVTAECLDVQSLFLIEDSDGESFAITRAEELDTERRHAWQQVITATS